MKLKRKCLAHYLDSTFGGSGTPKWFLVGKDIEEMNVELNPDVETKKNILGESLAEDNGYTPSIEADPYYANPDDEIYEKLLDIAMNRREGDECKTQLLEVIIEDPTAEAHKAWIEDVILKPKSYGGSSYVNIPYDIYFAGNRQEGTVAIANKVPTFTAN